MIFSPLRKTFIAGAGVLALATAGGVAVHAATSGAPTGATLTSTTPSPSPSPSTHTKNSTCLPGGVLGAAKQVLSIAAKDTGLTEQQILDQLRQGRTLDQIAGSKASTVESDVLAALKTRLDQAVSKGKLTSARETAMLAKAKTALDKAMSSNLSKYIPANGAPPTCGRHGKGDRMGKGLLQTLIKVTAEKTGLTAQQVMQDLRNGESIDQIAGSKAADIKATVLQELEKDLSSQLDMIMSHSGGFAGRGDKGGKHGFGGAMPKPGASPAAFDGTGA